MPRRVLAALAAAGLAASLAACSSSSGSSSSGPVSITFWSSGQQAVIAYLQKTFNATHKDIQVKGSTSRAPTT